MSEIIFELQIRKLTVFLKACDALQAHSDTALFKVTKKGLFIKLTDFESMCGVELRMTDTHLKLHEDEFSAKILLDSLLNILKVISKNKHLVILFAETPHKHILKVKEILNQPSQRCVNTHIVDSAEHRPRVYFQLSTQYFCSQSSNYLHFKLPTIEFNKIITMQAIASGSCGGVAHMDILPHGDELQRCTLVFSVQNHSGMLAKLTIHSFFKANTVPLYHIPAQPIHIQYLVSYLKRSQNLFPLTADFITLYISAFGILIQTDTKDQLSTIIFIQDTSQEDLASYGF